MGADAGCECQLDLYGNGITVVGFFFSLIIYTKANHLFVATTLNYQINEHS